MLAGLPPQALGAPALPARRPRQAAGPRDRPRRRASPVADKAESQDLCFLAGEGKAGFLARHGGLADREGEIVDAEGNVLGRHPGHHRFTVGQRRGIGLASPVPLYVLVDRRRGQPGRRRRRRGAADTRGCAIRDAVLHRPGRPGRRRSGSATAPAPLACRVGAQPRTGARIAAGRTSASSSSSRPGARRRAGPDRGPLRRRSRRRPRHDRLTAWSCRASLGHGAGSRSLRRREFGGDPRDLSVVLRGARAPARALGFADPRLRRPERAADDRRDAAVPALLPRSGDAAGAAAHLLPALLPDPRHRGGRQHRPPSDLLRDARQLRLRRLLQGGGDRVRLGALAGRLRLRPRADLGDGLRRRRGARPRPRHGGDRALEGAAAFPRSGSSCCRGRRTSGRPAAKGPCGPCSELYIDRGEAFGGPDDRPGDDTDRFLEYWNLVFTAYDLHEDGSLTELPAKNIDTGLGLERMAVIQQGVDSVFDTDLLRPLVDLAAELSGRPYGGDDAGRDPGDADHRRPRPRLGPADRRRRRPLERAPRLRAAADHAPRDLPGPRARPGAALPRAASPSARSRCSAPVNPALVAERDAIMRWIDYEEESFGRTLDRGSQLLERLIADAEAASTVLDLGRGRLRAPRHLRLPLRPDPRAGRRARPQRRRRGLRGADGAAARAGPDAAASARRGRRPTTRVIGFVGSAPGEPLRRLRGPAGGDRRRRRRRRRTTARSLVKLEESPFYAEGGGQVADSGTLRWDGRRGRGGRRLPRRRRPGAPGPRRRRPRPGSRVEAERRPLRPPRDDAQPHRHPPAPCGAPRAARHPRPPGRLGGAARQAPLRLHPRRPADPGGAAGDRRAGQRLDQGQRPRARDRDGSQPRPSGSARWRCSARSTATGSASSRSRASRASSAAAPTSPTPPRSASSRSSRRARAPRTSAGSRRSPGPPRSTSSASAATSSTRAGEALGGRDDAVAAAERLAGAAAASSRPPPPSAAPRRPATGPPSWPRRPRRSAGSSVVVGELGEVADARALLGAAHDIKARLGDAAVVLAATSGEKVSLVGVFAPAAVDRGTLGGRRRPRGGGDRRRRRRRQARGRAGRGPGRDEIGEALEAARAAVRKRTRGRTVAGMRILALDHGSARCGCAVSDPTGTIVTPIDPIAPPDPAAVAALVAEHGVETGRRRAAGQPRRRRGRAGRGRPRVRRPDRAALVDVPVETYDERLTTRMAAASRRAGSRAAEDSLAAAHLLDSYLLAARGPPMSDEPDAIPPTASDDPFLADDPRPTSASAAACSARRSAASAPAASRSRRGSAARSTAPPDKGREAIEQSKERAANREAPDRPRAAAVPPPARRSGAEAPGRLTPGRARPMSADDPDAAAARRRAAEARGDAARRRRPRPEPPRRAARPPPLTEDHDWFADADDGAPPPRSRPSAARSRPASTRRCRRPRRRPRGAPRDLILRRADRARRSSSWSAIAAYAVLELGGDDPGAGTEGPEDAEDRGPDDSRGLHALADRRGRQGRRAEGRLREGDGQGAEGLRHRQDRRPDGRQPRGLPVPGHLQPREGRRASTRWSRTSSPPSTTTSPRST